MSQSKYVISFSSLFLYFAIFIFKGFEIYRIAVICAFAYLGLISLKGLYSNFTEVVLEIPILFYFAKVQWCHDLQKLGFKVQSFAKANQLFDDFDYFDIHNKNTMDIHRSLCSKEHSASLSWKIAIWTHIQFIIRTLRDSSFGLVTQKKKKKLKYPFFEVCDIWWVKLQHKSEKEEMGVSWI